MYALLRRIEQMYHIYLAETSQEIDDILNREIDRYFCEDLHQQLTPEILEEYRSAEYYCPGAYFCNGDDFELIVLDKRLVDMPKHENEETLFKTRRPFSEILAELTDRFNVKSDSETINMKFMPNYEVQYGHEGDVPTNIQFTNQDIVDYRMKRGEYPDIENMPGFYIE